MTCRTVCHRYSTTPRSEMRSSSRPHPVKSFARRVDDCVVEAGWLNCNLPPGTATQTSLFWLTQHHRHLLAGLPQTRTPCGSTPGNLALVNVCAISAHEGVRATVSSVFMTSRGSNEVCLLFRGKWLRHSNASYQEHGARKAPRRIFEGLTVRLERCGAAVAPPLSEFG